MKAATDWKRRALAPALGLALALGSLGGTAPALASPGETYVVTGSVANLRAAPGRKAKVIARLARGTRVIEFRRRGRWVRVRVMGRFAAEGWVWNGLLRSSAAPPPRAGEPRPAPRPAPVAPRRPAGPPPAPPPRFIPAPRGEAAPPRTRPVHITREGAPVIVPPNAARVFPPPEERYRAAERKAQGARPRIRPAPVTPVSPAEP